jgi:hypothetical protein
VNTELIPFGTLGGLSSGLARQTKHETDVVVAQTEVARAIDDARSDLAANAVINVTTLVTQAQECARLNPAVTPYVELIVANYATGAAAQVARFLR